MQAPSKAQALLAQRNKLANSYQQLLDEFNSNELRSVGNYTLGRLIGKGSFGKVYLATHKLTSGSKVCLLHSLANLPWLLRMYTKIGPLPLGCSQIREQRRCKSCTGNTPSSPVCPPAHCTIIRSHRN